MSKKIKVFASTADFGCNAKVVSLTEKELMNNIAGIFDANKLSDIEPGDEIIISVKEMTEDELEHLGEFDGC